MHRYHSCTPPPPPLKTPGNESFNLLEMLLVLVYSFFFIYLNIFVEAFAQEQKCSSRELMLSQYLYLSKSTNVVQVQCMGSDVR